MNVVTFNWNNPINSSKQIHLYIWQKENPLQSHPNVFNPNTVHLNGEHMQQHHKSMCLIQ